jgi:DNA-binding Xre family transcriptional regulator
MAMLCLEGEHGREVMRVIIWKVKEVAQRQGVTSSGELAKITELAPGTAVALWYGRPTRIDLPTLNRVCVRLNCTPCDLLGFDGEEYSEENQNAEYIAEAA